MEQAKRIREDLKPRVRAFKPSLTAVEAEAASEAILSGWLGTGIYTRLFEARLARAAGVPFSLATNSGTAALHLALMALDLEGAEVVTTPVTSVATNHAILYNRATPVFCDVEPGTGNIDPRKIEALLTRKTKAIVVVHLGHACDMDPILEIARSRGLFVIEDACAVQAIGGRYKGRALGAMGDLGCFSFSRFKGLTTVDGGAVVYSRSNFKEKLERLRRHGLAGDDQGSFACRPDGVRELGFHYRMSDLCAAVGLAQIKRLSELQKNLDRLRSLYRERLEGASFLEWPAVEPYSQDVRAFMRVRVLGGRRQALQFWLRDRGIEIDDWLYPNHLYDLYRPYRRKLPLAERFCAESLFLPFYADLQDEDVDRIAGAIRRFKR